MKRKKKTNNKKGDRLLFPSKTANRKSSLSPFSVDLIENALERFLPDKTIPPREVHEAMRYAVLSGGKRFRPILVLSACEAVGGNPRRALVAACAVEFIHSYSLVHDDLPALDNDEMRRGIATCHKKFGEAMAILAGDALLTRAFQLLGEVKPVKKAVQLIRELSDAAGTKGMIGGQVMDLALVRHSEPRRGEESQILRRPSGPPQDDGGQVTVSALDLMSQNKTGRLIEASAVMGAIVGTNSSSKLQRIRRYGTSLGLAFQVVDDIMDGDGYLRLMNPLEAQQKLKTLIRKAREEAESFGKRGRRLLELADFLLNTAQKNVPVGLKN